MSQLQREVAAIATAARTAARALAKFDNAARDDALRTIAEQIREHTSYIIDENALDVTAAENNQLTAALLDRLRLDEARVEACAAAVDQVAAMNAVVGQVVERRERPNGLEVSRVRIPLGVVAIVYESRPNVTTDASALCLKAGNAAILRGGKEAIHSNLALGRAVAAGLERCGLPPAAVQIVPTTDRAAVQALLQHEQEIDLVIPRGGESLIRFVTEHSRIPVIKHYKGVCHVYVDADANQEMALAIADNAKCQRPGVCNAAETILVHRGIADAFLAKLTAMYDERGVEVRGDADAQRLGGPTVKPATEEDWHAEYLAPIVAVRVIDDLEAAIEHIEQYGSDHTEAIITDNEQTAERFARDVNSSTVVVNASTRFADGGELGLGAEIGISTTKLHAYGPMGAEGLTTTKFVVRGTGQVRK